MVTLRSTTLEDREAVFEMAKQLSPAFVVDHAAFMISFDQIFTDSSIYLRVAEDSGKIIGYLLGWLRPAFYSNGLVAWVQEVVVEPELRRRGVGRQLMEDFETWAACRNARLVSLASRGAKDFYEAIGYVGGATYYKKRLEP